jgi:hypothetical protein
LKNPSLAFVAIYLTVCCQIESNAPVGIRRLEPIFRAETTAFAKYFQYTRSLLALTRFNSFTEDFTEGSELRSGSGAEAANGFDLDDKIGVKRF